MKIGLVQYNPVIGDFKHNCQKILFWAQEAEKAGCSLVIFPELAVSGYPPQDLLERAIFIDEHDQAVQHLVAELPAIDVVFGAFEKREFGGGKKLYNSAFVARGGQVIYRVRKQLLPAYDVFDETRYFEPGTTDAPADFYEIQGHYFAITICEDIWHQEVDEYRVNPVETLSSKSGQDSILLDGLINISASPFQRGKENIRRKIFADVARQINAPLFYCNQVGGQDSLIFDGESMVLDRDGSLLCRAHAFQEDLLVYDTNTKSEPSPNYIQPCSEERIYQALVIGVRDYVNKCGFTSVVLGLSGGIDSALTAVIATDALGAENVLGVALPSIYSSEGSLRDAEQLAANLGCGFEIIPINDLFESFKTSLQPLFGDRAEDVTEQNLQARIRGNLLMALSNKFGHLLLSTGNKSEMAVGYCTLYGDMNGGLAVISDVPKQLVYDLARYANRESERIPRNTITKPPSAELKPDQRDQDDLPDYAILDAILELHLEQGLCVDEIVSHGFDAKVAEDIIRRVRLNEYKRKQAPMGLRVTSKAFGYGRRYPNVQNFQK